MYNYSCVVSWRTYRSCGFIPLKLITSVARTKLQTISIIMITTHVGGRKKKRKIHLEWIFFVNGIIMFSRNVGALKIAFTFFHRLDANGNIFHLHFCGGRQEVMASLGTNLPVEPSHSCHKQTRNRKFEMVVFHKNRSYFSCVTWNSDFVVIRVRYGRGDKQMLFGASK